MVGTYFSAHLWPSLPCLCAYYLGHVFCLQTPLPFCTYFSRNLTIKKSLKFRCHFEWISPWKCRESVRWRSLWVSLCARSRFGPAQATWNLVLRRFSDGSDPSSYVLSWLLLACEVIHFIFCKCNLEKSEFREYFLVSDFPVTFRWISTDFTYAYFLTSPCECVCVC